MGIGKTKGNEVLRIFKYYCMYFFHFFHIYAHLAILTSTSTWKMLVTHEWNVAQNE